VKAGGLLLRWFLAKLIFSTLKMRVICSSETSVDTQRTTGRNIPEDGTLHNPRCENLKSYIMLTKFDKTEIKTHCDLQIIVYTFLLFRVYHFICSTAYVMSYSSATMCGPTYLILSIVFSDEATSHMSGTVNTRIYRF
jgi:hypothetical protein